MKKVSIIVPVYNTSGYLCDCIDSILSQTYKNLQVILVNDGSTDDSGVICDQYARKDPRILVIHQKNAGVSTARNTGLDAAEGDYIAFFDSDDIVLPNMVEDMVSVLLEYNVEIVQSAGPISQDVSETGSVNVLKRDEVLDENFAFSDFYKPSLWLGIYKASLFHDIRFPDEIHFFEDFTVLTLLAVKTERVAFLDKRYYNYIQRDGSANHSGLTNKKRSAIGIPSYLEKRNVYRNLSDRRNTYSFFIVGRFMNTMTSRNAVEEDFEFIKQKIRGHYLDILLARAPKLSLRVVCLMYLLSPKFVKCIVKRKFCINNKK